MLNYKSIYKIKEWLISELAVIKAARELELISENKFKKGYEYISENCYYSDYVDKASDIAAVQIICILESELEDGEGAKNGKCIFNAKDSNGEKICDVLIISKSNIHAVNTVSMEYDFIEASESRKLMNIGYKVLDRFLCETNSDTIELTVIQPNLLTSSTCMVNIESLLKMYDINSF